MDSQLPNQNKDLNFPSGINPMDNDILRESDDEESNSNSSKSSTDRGKHSKARKSEKTQGTPSRKQSVAKEGIQSS